MSDLVPSLSVFVRLLTQSPSLVWRLSTLSSTQSASFTTSSLLLPKTSSTVPTNLPTSLVRSCRASKIPITSFPPNPVVLELLVKEEELFLSSSTTSSLREISPSSSSLRISSKPSSTWSTIPPTPLVRVLTVLKSPTIVDLTGPPSVLLPNQKAGMAG